MENEITTWKIKSSIKSIFNEQVKIEEENLNHLLDLHKRYSNSPEESIIIKEGNLAIRLPVDKKISELWNKTAKEFIEYQIDQTYKKFEIYKNLSKTD